MNTEAERNTIAALVGQLTDKQLEELSRITGGGGMNTAAELGQDTHQKVHDIVQMIAAKDMTVDEWKRKLALLIMIFKKLYPEAPQEVETFIEALNHEREVRTA